MPTTYQHEAPARNRPIWDLPNKLRRKQPTSVPLNIAARQAGVSEKRLLSELKAFGVQDVVTVDGISYFDTTDLAKYLAKRDLGLLNGSKSSIRRY